MIITILKAFQSDQFQYHKKSSQSLFTEKLLDKKNQVQVLTGILYSEYSIRLICLTLSYMSPIFHMKSVINDDRYRINEDDDDDTPSFLI